MLKTIKIRIYPNKEQEIYISKLLGSCRFVYNNILAYKIKEYNENKKSVSFGEACSFEQFSYCNHIRNIYIHKSLIINDKIYLKAFFNHINF